MTKFLEGGVGVGVGVPLACMGSYWSVGPPNFFASFLLVVVILSKNLVGFC